MKNQLLDVLPHVAFPDLAGALRKCKPTIIERWESAVEKMLPAAHELTVRQIRNSLPSVLDEMCDALESDRPRETIELAKGSRAHGETRFHQNYNVRQLIVEYRLLRQITLEEVSNQLIERLTAQQNVALNAALDVAVQSGLILFADYQREHLQAACELQSKYLSYLSHDLRNHLNHATLLLQLISRRLREVPGFGESVEDLEAVQNSIFQTMTGMDRLLQAERLRKEAIEPKLETIDLRALLEEMARPVDAEAAAKGLSIRVEVEGGSAIHSDRQLIALVLQNLVGNAIKYSMKGIVRLSAGKKDGRWTISVADGGPGIAAKQREHLFDAFTRGETFGQPGVGLGLSIAAQAARVLGAELKVESEPGHGAVFHLHLPETS